MAADGDTSGDVLTFGREILHDEARALDALADSLDGPFEEAVRLILGCRGKLIVGGLGKSGHVGRKIAATFASTGTTATFLHLAEAIHGDLGMASEGDVAILISQSGETAELELVIDHLQHVGIPLIAITGNSGSMLAKAAAAALVLPHWPEVGPEFVAPTTSTTMTLGARRCPCHDGDAAEGVHSNRFRATSSGRRAWSTTEAGQTADAFGRCAAADAQGRLDA